MKTVSIQEAVEELRATGMRISPDTLRNGIEQGVFPFGIHVETRSGGHIYYVFSTQLESWINDRS